MDKILKAVFSMSIMALALFSFFGAIAIATFVENDYGTPVAQKWIYKSTWFSLILGYLSLSLIYNIFRYQMIQQKKFGTLVFHVALLVIILGAFVTRKIGFEGVMTIREGESSNYVISADTYVHIKVHDMKQQYTWDMPIILDTNVYERDAAGKPDYSHNYFEHTFEFPGQADPVHIEFVDLVPNVKDTLIAEVGGKTYLEIVTVGKGGRDYNYLESGKILDDGGIKIAFNNSNDSSAIRITESDSGIYVISPYEMTYLQMSDQSEGLVKADSLQVFHTKRLYNANGFAFVFSQYYPSAFLETISSHEPPKGFDGVKVRVSQGALEQEVMLRGGKGFFPNNNLFQLGDLYYELAYGSKIIELPFSIYLRDFELERYPGTMNPSSFASEVTVVDHSNGSELDHRIYMNNVLDYGGYRFFQSSYDSDEKGTILSVNYDAPGTMITYMGYFLLGLGFVLNLFARESRFRHLIRKSRELKEKSASAHSLLLLVGLLVSLNLGAQVTKVVDYNHAEKFSRLVIQDQGGRFKPVHTLASELLRKVYRSDTYKGQSAMQVFLGIHTNNLEWNLEPLIAVPNEIISKKLNLPEGEKYACIQDFISPEMTYLLEEDVRAAQMKRPAVQSKYDKDILKVDERFNIMLGVFSGFYFKIFPLPEDSTNTWYSPFQPELPFAPEDLDFIHSTMTLYFNAVDRGYETGDWAAADQAVQLIDLFQQRMADPAIMPSQTKIDWEIRYNKMNLFKRLNYVYLLVGFILLIFNLIQLFSKKYQFRWVLAIGFWIFLTCFVMHGVGLGLRWYLSGHAPWSNGYEAVVFIAFITVLAGLLFYRQNKIVLGATGILAWLMLFVAHMNTLDPEITNLVPVLKSYWLMIHVAVITGSYGFLGLAAILALVNLGMFVFVNERNKSVVNLNSRQLTYVIEMTMIIGLFMLTIGTFLGGVWANESWGRYWGWDAKETWALASVLIYAIILHFRFIPGLKSHFAMTVAALWGYSTIIMTFFGVNFYLSGLHSYAQGDPVPIPAWIPTTVILLFALTILSYLRYRITFKKQ